MLVAYGVWGLWRPALPQLSRQRRWLGASVGALVGVITGMVTAATAVFVIPLVAYLQALRLDKDEMVQALGLSFTVATLALTLRLQAAGALTLRSPSTLVALLAAFAGLWLGTRLRARISSAAFQRSLFVVCIGLGVANLLRAGS